ncbi:MAG TPA: TonB-dependent receptor [Sphingomicrobium sp.]|nr:TonB-dependent receptor [Sphingomicrobium sp.]
MIRVFLASAAAIALVSGPARASDAPEAATATDVSEAGGAAESADAPTPGSAQDAHRDRDEAIVVTGVRRTAGDVLGGVSVLDEAELDRQLRTSIGETLARLPGVSATSFGPVASAPVLRGLSGDRVRVLTDGIGTLDLSSSGPDHAVAINPITAERIEVLRGPAALLFGSSAIGGVVNVIDTRIPRRMPDGPVHAGAIAQYGSAADERSTNAAVDVPLGDRFVIHADGNLSKTDDLRTGGFILSKELREEALLSPDPEIRALADLKGKLPNSASKSAEGALGAAYVDGALNIGVSVARHTQTYEVPIRYSLEPGFEPEAPTIDLEQTRYDARAEIPLGGIFNQLTVRGGYSDYHHDELEDTGEVGSSFFGKGGEARVTLVQSERSGWGGTSGAQYLERSARIRGEEKFLPDSRQRQTGLFTLQTYVSGPLRLEGGARVEFSKRDAEADAQLATPALSRDFTTVSGSLGGQYEFSPGWRAGLSVSHSERAPSIDELFARGPHLASQSFEAGNPDLNAEKGNSVELTLHRIAGPVHLTANLYYSRFSNFIFLAPTGEVEDELPVFEYRQDTADYYGFEIAGDARFGKALGIDWGAEFQADAVRATVEDFGPAPLIPPLRLLGALTGSRGQVDGRIEVEKAFAHNRTAPDETGTPGYTMVNAALDWHPFADRPELTLSLIGSNLFDVEARRSTSLLKDFAPLAGRDIRLSARIAF